MNRNLADTKKYRTAKCPVCEMPGGYHDHGQSNSKHDAHYVPWNKVVNLKERVAALADSLCIEYDEAVKVFIAGRIKSSENFSRS